LNFNNLFGYQQHWISKGFKWMMEYQLNLDEAD